MKVQDIIQQGPKRDKGKNKNRPTNKAYILFAQYGAFDTADKKINVSQINLLLKKGYTVSEIKEALQNSDQIQREIFGEIVYDKLTPSALMRQQAKFKEALKERNQATGRKTVLPKPLIIGLSLKTEDNRQKWPQELINTWYTKDSEGLKTLTGIPAKECRKEQISYDLQCYKQQHCNL